MAEGDRQLYKATVQQGTGGEVVAVVYAAGVDPRQWLVNLTETYNGCMITVKPVNSMDPISRRVVAHAYTLERRPGFMSFETKGRR